jgi:Na+/proline symporter
MLGGVQAVTWTDVKTMSLTIVALVVAMVFLVRGLPDGVGVNDALVIAGGTGRLQAFDFRFTLTETYTFWSGMLGGLFLMLSYFGCDQSQVQRYLTAKSVDEGRRSLLMSAYYKIPLQAVVLLTGVLVFVFYLFNEPPMLFNRVHADAIGRSPRAGEFRALELEFSKAFEARRDVTTALAHAPDGAARDSAVLAFRDASDRVASIRARAASLVQEITGDERYGARTGDTPVPDVNYVFPHFVVTRMPLGLVGLMIAAIFAAAMSSIAAELNSLATSTVIDIYKRMLRPAATDAHYLVVSKLATGLWGIVACVVAMFAAGLGSLIEVVNRFGSFFYGSLLGVFVLALGFRRANGTGAFVGLAAGIAAVALFAFHPATKGISFLWQNPLGVIVVLIVGMSVSLITAQRTGD